MSEKKKQPAAFKLRKGATIKFKLKWEEDCWVAYWQTANGGYTGLAHADTPTNALKELALIWTSVEEGQQQ